MNSRSLFVTFTSLTPLSKSKDKIFNSGNIFLSLFSMPLSMMWFAMHPKGWSEMTFLIPFL